jgi:hypothetical protein
VMQRVVQQKMAIGEATRIGSVVKRFSNLVVGMRMKAGSVGVGDEVVIMHKNSCHRAAVVSIQIGQSPYERLDVREGQEIGLRLSAKANKSAELVRIASPQPVPLGAMPEPISPDDDPVLPVLQSEQ